MTQNQDFEISRRMHKCFIKPGDAAATDAPADDSAVTTVAAEDPTTTTTAAPGDSLCSFCV